MEIYRVIGFRLVTVIKTYMVVILNLRYIFRVSVVILFQRHIAHQYHYRQAKSKHDDYLTPHTLTYDIVGISIVSF